MDSNKLRCYVDFLGCEKRKLDAQRVINYLRANGYGQRSRPESADVIVFLTCAFCNKYENFSVTKLEKIYTQKKNGTTFIVGGCLPAIHPERLAGLTGIIQIKARELDALDSILNVAVPMRNIEDPNTSLFDQRGTNLPRVGGFKSPAECEYEAAKRGYKIRINWGCRGNCAYCVTRLAEGSLESKPLPQVLKEVQQGLNAGFHSFLFTGGDTGAYGADIGISTVALLRAVFAFPGKFTVHFHDFGMQWLIQHFSDLLQLFQANAEKLGCFCFPVQSGSNKVLRSMRRAYTNEQVRAKLLLLKERVPALKLGTHFIVGFPGETDEDFQETIRLLRDIPFDFVNVYRYTDHVRADASHFPGKVPAKLIVERNAILDQIFREKMSYNGL